MGSKSAVMAATKPPAPMTNGLAKKSSASSSPALINLFPPSRQNSLRSNSISPSTRSSIGEEISLGEIFRLIAQMRVCIVRRAGSDVDGQISSLIEAATARSISPRGSEEAENNSPVPHFLSVGQQSAGQMLDWVQRKGLPLIFLNGDCVGGFSDLKALDKCGFLAESLCPHLFDLVVIGGGEVAETAVQEAVQLGKRVALVELVQSGSNNGDQRKSGDSSQLAKQAVNQAALMRTAIEEARTSGWTVEGEQGQQVSFWLNWQSVRAVAQAQAQAQRQSVEASFQQGKAQRFAALACQFTSFHELTICPEAESAERFQQEGLLKLTAARFLLTAKAETKALENVPGAKQHCISNYELFSLPHNPGKTLFCCEHDSEPAVLESAAILRALGNDVTIMSYVHGTALKSGERSAIKAPSILNPYDPEMVEYAKQRMAEKGVRFLRCVPTKFELMRESTPDQAPILRVFAMSMGKEGPMTTADKKAGITEEWSPFLEEFNTVILSIGKRAEPFPALGLEKIGVQLDGDNGRIVGRSQQPQSNSMPNIYAIGDALEGAIDGGTGWWNCFAAMQLLRRMFQGAMAEIDQWDLCRTLLLLSPLQYAGCGLSQPEAERRHGKSSLSIFRDAEVPMLGVEKAKMICLRQEQNRVIGLHIMGPQAGHQLEGYALAMQLGLTKARMEAMGRQ